MGFKGANERTRRMPGFIDELGVEEVYDLSGHIMEARGIGSQAAEGRAALGHLFEAKPRQMIHSSSL